ncbi:MAG: tetratricopeptide repeat-containing sensor histidine kinase [Cytophagales bacterium]|nr:tetratricopeptide repeat-containing sensor histidine kinase [Cytophagales bacterium]
MEKMDLRTAEETDLIQKMLTEAYASRINDLTKSKRMAEKALKLSREIDDLHLIGKCLSDLSLYYMILGEYESCIQFGEEAIGYFSLTGDEKGIADAKYSLAGALYKTDEFNRGLNYLTECIPVFKKFEDHHNTARTFKSIGTIYEYFGDEKAAIEAYQYSIEAGILAKDLNVQSNAYNPLSGIYLNKGRTKDAMELIQKSIAMKNETNDVRGLAFALYGRGKVYTKLEQYELAEIDYFEAIRIHEEMGEKLGAAMTFHKLGSHYLQKGDLEQSNDYLQKGLKFANENRIALIKFKCYYLLYEIHKKQGNTEKALHYLENFVREKELVINTRSFKIIEGYDAIAKMEVAESEIQAQKEKSEIIEKKNLELDAFFYRVSHDLKGPINSLLGLDMIVNEEIKDETTREYLGMYRVQIQRINQILDGLIKVTRMSHTSEKAEPVKFEQLIEECLKSYQFMTNFSRIDFEVEIADSLEYRAEWALMNTIIQNLLENAIKYARIPKNEPKIYISATEHKGAIVIKVQDNGVGIDPEQQEKIFEMFYQSDRKQSGVGLGLYIIKRAVDQLEGTIKLESEPGVGSKFTVKLPKYRKSLK